MVKAWQVKHSGQKAAYMRKEPRRDDSEANVLALVPNGEVVTGEFMYISRASTEAGFVKLKHLEQQCGTSWRVRHAEGYPTTLVRKQPTESQDPTNTVGYAHDGEIVEGGFIFAHRKSEKRGGFFKIRHLRTLRNSSKALSSGQTSDMPASKIARSASADSVQRWAVNGASPGGASMRKEPRSDSTAANVVRLIANGDEVLGEFVHVHCSNGDVGFVKFTNLERQSGTGGKTWRVRCRADAVSATERGTLLRRHPHVSCSSVNTVAVLKEGELVDAEYMKVAHTIGAWTGYIKLNYLTPLAP